jgi:CubicO group peptidase (beta-lactamase class C family)
MGWRQNFCATVFAVFAAASAFAADAPRLPTLDAIMEDFASQNGLRHASLAVMEKGRLVHYASYGGAAGAEPVAIASLSKSITGACIATLIQSGRLGLDSRLGDVLADYFRSQGEPRDARVRDLTVRHLLIHRSGFETNNNLDPVTKALKFVLAAKPAKDVTLADLLKYAYSVPLAREPGSPYKYSNVGYITLSLVVEAVTGRAYEDYCNEAAIERVRSRGRLHPAWGMQKGSGGWAMTPAEYLAFLRFFEPGPDSPLQSEMRAFFEEAPDSYTSDKKDYRYTLGLYVRKYDNGSVTWNRSGALTWVGGSDKTSVVLDSSARSYAERLSSGQSYAYFYDGSPAQGASTSMKNKVVAAIRATKQWPAEDGFAALGLK